MNSSRIWAHSQWGAIYTCNDIYVYIYTSFILLIFSKVKLDTQVLRKSIMISLQESGNKEVLGTANFCGMMNDFFDCANVRSRTEHIRKKNNFIKPYTSTDNECFSWLLDIFVKYLNDWKKNTSKPPWQIFTSCKTKNVLVPADTRGSQDISIFSCWSFPVSSE